MNAYERYAEEYLDRQYMKLISRTYLIIKASAGEELEELGLKYFFLGCKDKAVRCMEKAADAYCMKHSGADNADNIARSEEVRKWLKEIHEQK